MTTAEAIRILRQISAYGNPVAATWLHLLETQTNPDYAQHIISQVETFVSCWQYESSRRPGGVGPSEIKGENVTVTPALRFIE